MLSLHNLFNALRKKILNQIKVHSESNIQARFIRRVLFPPFVVLFILGVVSYWQLNNFVHQRAINDLTRSAETTAAKLEREFTIRQTILKRSGEELFVIKSEYQNNSKQLEKDRDVCRSHLKVSRDFAKAPNDACDPFLSEFAKTGVNIQTVEQSYKINSEKLIAEQNYKINDRLAAYKQFFPETLALLVVDKQKQIVSSALSEGFTGSVNKFSSLAQSAQKTPVEGKFIETEDTKLAIFAYPIKGGSVLAAYNVDSESFLYNTWKSTPIDRKKAAVIITDAEGKPVYPDIKVKNNILSKSTDLRKDDFINISINSMDHIAVGAEADKSKWLVVVASPTEAVLAPIRDAQLIALLVIGGLITGFLWVGSFFIKRIVLTILGLVSGALIFASGKLDYKIVLKQADQEFNQLADTMNLMAERISKAEKEIDEKNKEFISVATHELRAPMTAIIGNLSIVSDEFSDKLDPEVRPMLDQAYKGTIRLRDLVNDMLDVARLEGGRTEFTLAPVEISTIIDNVIETMNITAKYQNITLNYSKQNAAKVIADEAKLRIILNNFISNAIKYNRPNGTVTVSHLIKDNELVTSVSDTGLGIPESQQSHIFEKFYRVEDADRKSVTGTGLGAYITKQYVEAMGGKVWFESKHGQGTTFYFSLPLSR